MYRAQWWCSSSHRTCHVITYTEYFHFSWQNVFWHKAKRFTEMCTVFLYCFNFFFNIYIYVMICHSDKNRHKLQVSIYLKEDRKLTKKLLWESTSHSTLSVPVSKSGKNQVKSEWARKRYIVTLLLIASSDTYSEHPSILLNFYFSLIIYHHNYSLFHFYLWQIC